jgi:hypothetical protein
MENREGLTASFQELADIGDRELSDMKTVVARPGLPSRPLFGVLPLRRVVPQDVHSVLDYAGGLTLIAAGLAASSRFARNAGIGLGAAVIGTSLLTDYRLSAAKVVPIEAHEAADYAAGLTALAVPFFGAFRGRLAKWLHLGVGLTVVIGSLFTDYRAFRGKGRR